MFYTDYWGLDFPPFANDNRTETFVPVRSAALAIGRLRYGLGMRMGASAIIGPPGVGKSRIVRRLLTDFADAGWHTAYCPCPQGGPARVLAALDPEAAARLRDGDGDDALELVQDLLVRRARENTPVVLAVDDVQTAGMTFLEMLRTLLNIEADGVHGLSIILSGQQTMLRRLEQASGFDSQLMVRAVLEPMDDDEARVYILARLKAAGSRQGIFTRQAAEHVVNYARGNPRQINRLCDLALVIGYGMEVRKITPELIDQAAADLDLVPAEDLTFFPRDLPDVPPPQSELEAAAQEESEDILATLEA